MLPDVSDFQCLLESRQQFYSRRFYAQVNGIYYSEFAPKMNNAKLYFFSPFWLLMRVTMFCMSPSSSATAFGSAFYGQIRPRGR
jgi:hypothetical protein